MSSLSLVQSNRKQLICELPEKTFLSSPPATTDEQAFLECYETLDERDLQDYHRLTKTAYSAANETRFKKPETKTDWGDVALGAVALGGGFLLGGPVGLGVGALLLAGCYPVEDIGVAEQNNNRAPQTEEGAEAEGEIEHGNEAEAEGDVEPGAEAEAEAEGEGEIEGESEAEAEAESEWEGGTWIEISTEGVPSARYDYTAIWTGSEMIVWGGSDGFSRSNTGGRYSPVENRWTTISADGAPSRRSLHTAVWTGSEMIVWGGRDSDGNQVHTGGRYNPIENRWTPTNIDGAPSARYKHTTVWTGSEMIVWGGAEGEGADGSDDRLNTGGRYDPVEDHWTPTSTSVAPAERNYHSAIWTGTEMIVWGGFDVKLTRLNTGGRYDPVEDRWTSTRTVGAPSARNSHTAVWTASEMIVWGGRDVAFGGSTVNTGGRYNPVENRWTSTTTTDAPSRRTGHSAVWTGSEMIVWGGWTDSYYNTGSLYDPAGNNWVPISEVDAPSGRGRHNAFSTGSEMIVWGGEDCCNALNTGGRYAP